MKLHGILPGEMELMLQVSLRDLDVSHGHADIFMSEQSHECRKADAEADHFRGEGVPELVAGNRMRAACSFGSTMQGEIEISIQGCRAGRAGYQQTGGFRQMGCGSLRT